MGDLREHIGLFAARIGMTKEVKTPVPINDRVFEDRVVRALQGVSLEEPNLSPLERAREEYAGDLARFKQNPKLVKRKEEYDALLNDQLSQSALLDNIARQDPEYERFLEARKKEYEAQVKRERLRGKAPSALKLKAAQAVVFLEGRGPVGIGTKLFSYEYAIIRADQASKKVAEYSKEQAAVQRASDRLSTVGQRMKEIDAMNDRELEEWAANGDQNRVLFYVLDRFTYDELGAERMFQKYAQRVLVEREKREVVNGLRKHYQNLKNPQEIQLEPPQEKDLPPLDVDNPRPTDILWVWIRYHLDGDEPSPEVMKELKARFDNGLIDEADFAAARREFWRRPMTQREENL